MPLAGSIPASGTMNIKGLHDIPHASPFSCSYKRLPSKSSRQTLKPSHSRQPLDPLGTPVGRRACSPGLASRAPRLIALIFARILVRIGIAATTALHSIEFAAGGEVVALVPTGQMPVDFEMNDHGTSPW